MECNSCGEGCAYRLDQHPVEIEHAQQLLLLRRSLLLVGSGLMGVTGVAGGLGDGDAQIAGVERHLGDKAGGSIGTIRLVSRGSQGLTVTDQLIEIAVLLCDLGQHPLAQHGEQALQIHPPKKVEKGGVGGCAAKLKTEGRIEGQAVPACKSLQIPGAAEVTENSEDGQQQQQPLGIAHAPAHATLRKRLQDED